MDGGAAEVGDVLSALFRHDAHAEAQSRQPGRLVFDSPPAPGDLVLIVDAGVARVVRFDEDAAPDHPVWIVAVIRRPA
jgi:hypothetical protein